MALNLNKLSLWELAHRWHGHDPHRSGDARDIPLEVKDTLRNLAKEIRDESLYSTLLLSREAEWHESMTVGFVLAWRPWWRKPAKEAVSDYAEDWRRCIRGNVIDQAFLEAVEIPVWELEYWRKENQVPMTEFWVRPRGFGGEQFPLPGARPFEDGTEPGEGVVPDEGKEAGASEGDSPSAHRRAALARHEPVNELKRECVRFWLRNPKLSQAQAAKGFLKQLDEGKRGLLSADRAEKTLAAAISEYHRKLDRPWLEGFDPENEPQTGCPGDTLERIDSSPRDADVPRRRPQASQTAPKPF